jgi:hypothetical protein
MLRLAAGRLDVGRLWAASGQSCDRVFMAAPLALRVQHTVDP